MLHHILLSVYLISERSFSVRRQAVNEFCELLKKSGNTIFVEIIFNDKAINNKYLTIIFKDITKYKKDSELMHYYAYYDNLTNLPNRLLFKDRSELAIKQAKRLKELVCFMFIDLDDFKSINDKMGHETGDQLLKSISIRFTKIIRETDTVSRWGGDEFLILIPQIHNVKDALLFAERIIESNNKPLEINGKLIYTKTSIGISVYPEDGDNINKLINNADNAMYKAKRQGKNQFLLFKNI